MSERLFKCACAIHLDYTIHRYLLVNTAGRLNGYEKALRHQELCEYYVAVTMGLRVPGEARTYFDGKYQAVHAATLALTDYMDEVIDFPLNNKSPNYVDLAPKFFEKFHELAMSVL